MNRLAHHAVALTLLAAPGLALAQANAEPPVKIHVDVHLPGQVPAVEVPASPPPAAPPHPRPGHHHQAPPAWRDGAEDPHRHGGHGHDDRRHGHGGPEFHVPPDRVPGRGLCRIWYDDLPPDRQPPPMPCDRAHRVARRHGGRVIWAASPRAHEDGRVASAPYGRVDLRGVPPDRLPPPGSCRVWLDGVPPDRQPPPGPCGRAERDAHRTGGRLLYMPGP